MDFSRKQALSQSEFNLCVHPCGFGDCTIEKSPLNLSITQYTCCYCHSYLFLLLEKAMRVWRLCPLFSLFRKKLGCHVGPFAVNPFYLPSVTVSFDPLRWLPREAISNLCQLDILSSALVFQMTSKSPRKCWGKRGQRTLGESQPEIYNNLKEEKHYILSYTLWYASVFWMGYEIINV